MISKNNVPYLVAGALATLTLLASGVFAVAPYIGFLAPVTALSVGLPFIIGCAVFSAVIIALSYKAISKNKTISKKDAELTDKTKEIKDKEKTICEKEAQLTDKTKEIEDKNGIISEKEAQLDQQNTEISDMRSQHDQDISHVQKQLVDKATETDKEIVENSSVSKLAEAALVGAMATGGIAGGMAGCTLGPVMLRLYIDKSIVLTTKKEDEVYELAKGILDSVGSSVNKVYNAMPSIESAKGTLGSGVKSIYDTSVGYTTETLNAVGSGVNKVYNAVPSIESAKGTLGSGAKNAYGTSVEYVKGKFNSAGNKLKNVTDIYDLSKAVDSARNRLKHVEAYTACEEVGTTVKEAYSSGRIFYIAERRLKDVYGIIPSAKSARNWVPSLKTAGWIAGGAGLLVGTTYITVNGGLSIAGNSFNVAGNSTNGTESDASISNSSSVYYRPTDQQIKQSQIHEINKKLADTNKWYEDNYGTPKEDSLSNKGIFSSICNKVSSVWSSLGNLISGSNEGAHNCSEPQWCKDLHKSEDLEEIIDGGVLDNLFFPRVDNSINTSKQQSTLIDSVDLEKLIQEPHPSAYPNGSPRIL